MANLDLVKRNVAKMVSMNAPEADIDGYIASEGTTIDAVRAHKVAPPPGYGGASVDTSDPRPMWDFFADTARAFNESKESLMNREPGGLGSSLGMAKDVIGMVASPITGGVHSAFGSAFSYLPIGIDEQGIKTLGKTRGDAMADAGMAGFGPRGLSAGRVVASAPKVAAPSVAELKQAHDVSRLRAENAGLELNPASTQKLAGDITADLQKSGFRDYAEPRTFRAVEELNNPAGPTVTVADLDQPRRVLGKVGPGSSDYAAANSARRQIDDYLENVPPQDVIKGDPAAVAGSLKEARGNYSAAKRAELIDEAVRIAELNAGSANSGQNIENAIRQQLKIIAKDPKKLRGFSDAEIAQLEKAIKGSNTGNILRALGNMLGGGGGAWTSILSGIGGTATWAGGMGPIGMALPAAGFGFKRAGAASTRNQVNKLNEMLRSRSPLGEALGGQQFGPPAPRSPILDGITFGLDSESLMRKERARAE